METSVNQDVISQASNGQKSTPAESSALPQAYQEAVLKCGIQAADLLTELIGLKLMPDPRAKEMADVALEVLKLLKDSPAALQNLDIQPLEVEEEG